MSETKLLPCPFCGSKNVGLYVPKLESWVKCHECDAQGPSSEDRNNAEEIAAWNTRPTPALTPKQEACDAMYEALKMVRDAFRDTPYLLEWAEREDNREGASLGFFLSASNIKTMLFALAKADRA